ncbi:MAG: 2-oxo acid dehydrogenase subunit E2, partial [Acidimicrobiales bacterium]
TAPEAAPAPPATAPPEQAPAPTGSAPRTGLGQAPFGPSPLRGVRRLTAEAMTQSWSTIPHITGMDEIDATPLLETRRRLKEQAGEAGANLTPLALLVAAAARALRRYPLVNAGVAPDGQSVTVHERCNIGVAVATDDGLIVPILTDADRRGVLELADEIARLSAAARRKQLSAAELRGGTFTITNYGAIGGRFATPLIRPGEAGILGFGAIRPRPLVVDGEVTARPTLPVVFSADHRIIDGDLSVAFQEHVLSLLAEPLLMLL